MTEAGFWGIVGGTTDAEDQAGALEAALAECSSEQILDFAQHLQRLLAVAYAWDLWDVAYLMKGGASDDSFLYFRGWLIGRGREVFESAVADPESLADRVAPDDWSSFEDEALLYASEKAFRRVTGDDWAYDADSRTAPCEAAEPSGERWEESEISHRFPTVAARFSRSRDEK
jgi:hypothetical protein